MDPQLYRDFGRLEDTHWWFAGRRAVIQEVLGRRLPPAASRRILDVGCGTGGMLLLLRELGQVEGMDGADEALAEARRRVGPDVPLTRGQLPGGLPPGRTWDLVTAFDVIEHIPDPIAALVAVRRALSPSGRVVVSVPAYQFLWSRHDELNHHQRRYTLGLLRDHLGEAGLRIEWASYFNTLLFPPIAAVRLAQRLLPARGSGSDFSEAPPLVNRALGWIFSSERRLLARTRLPFGVSILAVAAPAPGA